MNDTEINIAIAEACGWRPPEKVAESWWAGMSANEKNGRCEYCGCHFCDCTDSPPSYTTDLNAMQSAEEHWILSADCEYLQNERAQLLEIAIVAVMKGERRVIPQSYRATARQRAEAFLRTIGKWKE